MSAENSVAPAGAEIGSAPSATGAGLSFSIPDELVARYQVRVIEASAGGERRVGMFVPGDRTNPAIEIGDQRIFARSGDAETITALVQLAQHNGWNRIEVDGSPEFRKAVWTEAARAGLEVGGYEPSFAEREQAEQARRGRTDQNFQASEPERGRPAASAADTLPLAAGVAASQPSQTSAASEPVGRDLSDGDSRLLLRISALSEDRRGLVETLAMDMPSLAREVQMERVAENREALVTALDRALDSPSLTQTFERSGFPADELRALAVADEWDGDIADAIYLVRTGLHREAMRRMPAERGSDIEVGSVLRGPAEGATLDDRAGGPERQEAAGTSTLSAGGRRDSRDALADLFLNGSPEQIAADPRLASAVRAQSAMEQHIAEVFQGDAGRTAAANLEGRQMIADVLRQGLDVGVREPAPNRRIEPAQVLEMER